MDGRWLVLAGGLACMLGCTPFGGKQLTGGSVEAAKQAPGDGKPPPDLKPETSVSFADTQVEAALAPDRPPL